MGKNAFKEQKLSPALVCVKSSKNVAARTGCLKCCSGSLSGPDRTAAAKVDRGDHDKMMRNSTLLIDDIDMTASPS